MTPTAVAVLLIGIWLILTSQTTISDTATLIWGIVVATLALVDLVGGLPVTIRRPQR